MERQSVVLVDERDRTLGACAKLEAHRRGLLHRAFSVFVFRVVAGRLELLLQRRAQGKYHCGGLWSNTCCSHPQPRERLLASAQRRLQEELGFSAPLKRVDRFRYQARLDNGLIENEIDHVLIGRFEDQQLWPDDSEVDAVEWAEVTQLNSRLRDSPQRFTPWLPQALRLALSSPLLSSWFPGSSPNGDSLD